MQDQQTPKLKIGEALLFYYYNITTASKQIPLLLIDGERC
jgi:hypothetical protein